MMLFPKWREASLSCRVPDGNPSEAGSARILGGLALALGAYAGFGRPAPLGIGVAEAAVAAGLLAATGLARPVGQTLGARAAAGGLAFLWLLWVPLLRGVAEGHAPRDMVRDIVPLGFLFLPALLGPALAPMGARAVRWLALGLAATGVVFAARWLLAEGGEIGRIAVRSQYLVNSPSVLFAAVWLPLAGLEGMRRGGWRILPATAAALAGLVPLHALVSEVHRAAIGLACLAGLAWFVLARGYRSALVGGALAALAAVIVVAGGVDAVVDSFAAKTRIHGWNGRIAEFRAVLDRAGAAWSTLLFGAGWGGLIRNPAVGEWWVSYTHAFPGYLLFKTGLAGCLAAGIWLWGLVPAWLRLVRRDAALACALVPPLAVGLLFHTSFKYLCFGLVLTLLWLAAAAPGRDEDAVARDGLP